MLQGVRFSCLLFAQESPIIMAGMSNGNVAVVRIHDVYDSDASSTSQVSNRFDMKSPDVMPAFLGPVLLAKAALRLRAVLACGACLPVCWI